MTCCSHACCARRVSTSREQQVSAVGYSPSATIIQAVTASYAGGVIDFTGADFTGADVAGADFTAAKLEAGESDGKMLIGLCVDTFKNECEVSKCDKNTHKKNCKKTCNLC